MDAGIGNPAEFCWGYIEIYRYAKCGLYVNATGFYIFYKWYLYVY